MWLHAQPILFGCLCSVWTYIDDGIGGLNVTVLDTLCDDKVDFMKRRPIVPTGRKYVDPDFDKETALGQYASETDWKRPEVRV